MKLMIVDDEIFVRDGIKKAFCWDQEGIEIIAEAGDGRSAITKAIQTKPDIILCDIRMPKMDGISFAKQIKQMLPDVKIIMLTAYADKEYMLEAIRCGISDFLLKPAGLDQIRQTVLKVQDEIQQERSCSILLAQRDELIEENASLFHEHYLSALLEDRIQVDKIKEAIRLLHIPLDGPCYSVLLLQPLHDMKWPVVQLLCGKLARWKPVVTQVDQQMVMMVSLLGEADYSELIHALHALEQDLQKCHRGALLLTNMVSDLGLLPQAYSGVKSVFPRCIWLENGRLVTDDRLQLPAVHADDIQETIKRLHQAFDDQCDIQDAASNCYDRLAGMKLSPAQFGNCMEQIAHDYYVHYGIYLQDMNGMISKTSFLEQICSQQQDAISMGSGHTRRALRYIQSHYMHDIQLEDVAKALYLSTTYVSRILNENGNRGFIGWLRYFRIKKACELLQNHQVKNYEICEQVGYKSYKVFSDHFQKEIGQTIGAWKRNEAEKAEHS